MPEPGLDASQIDRYARHVIMDDVGPDGQATLLASAVLVVGAGGLGSPVLQYLAAAGVGTIGVADDEAVERSNLQRQVLHGTDDVGRPKVESAADAIADLNPDVTVETYERRVAPAEAPELVGDYDVVVDASDNFPTRFLLNDACVLADTPLVHGAIYRFEGQATTICGGNPCYRCLFPEAPPEGAVPDCAEAGVLGVLPGAVGAIQATEALKLLLGEGKSLEGRLLVYDASEMTFEEVPVAPNPDCPICGDEPVIGSVAEASYDGRCALGE
ncbi:SAMP-activating enzyme E1 [Halobacteriales archaeon Cl-PHB]